MAKYKLPRGIRENKGTYEARAMVNGVKISLYGSDLGNNKAFSFSKIFKYLLLYYLLYFFLIK